MKQKFAIKIFFKGGHVAYCIDSAYDSYHQNLHNAEQFDSEEAATNRAIGHIRHFKTDGYFLIEKFYV
jgi:hypothetical protein